MEPEKETEPLNWPHFSSRALALMHSEVGFNRLINLVLMAGWIMIGGAVISIALVLLSFPLELILDKPLSISRFETIPLLGLGIYGILIVCFAKICLFLGRIERHLRTPETSTPETSTPETGTSETSTPETGTSETGPQDAPAN